MADWVKIVNDSGGNTRIDHMIVFNGKLYSIGATPNYLLEWDGVASVWTAVTNNQFGGATQRIVAMGSSIYRVINSFLYKWSTGDTIWNQVTTVTLGTGTVNNMIETFNGNIYTQDPDEKLMESAGGTGEFTQAAPAPSSGGGNSSCRQTCVYNGKLYVATVVGELFEWNGTDTLVQRAPVFGTNDEPVCLIVEGGYIYTVYGASGELLRWSTGDSVWTQVHAGTGASTLTGAVLYSGDGEFYAVTNSKVLYKNTGTSWTPVSTQSSDLSFCFELIEFNNKLYSGGS